MGGEQRYAASGAVTCMAEFSPPVPASEIGFYLEDLDAQNVSVDPSTGYTLTVNGGTPNGIFTLLSTTQAGVDMNYNPAVGRLSLNGLVNNQKGILVGTTDNLVSTLQITGDGDIDFVGYSFFARTSCDTDGDSIPDLQDIDSDGDGCPDATEAGYTYNETTEEIDGTGYNTDGTVAGSDGYMGTDPLVTDATVVPPGCGNDNDSDGVTDQAD